MSYPLTSYHFEVEWSGSRIGFTEVTGLDHAVQMIPYREGSSPVYQPMLMPGQVQSGTVELKRGMMPADNEFFTWINTISLNDVERRDITIKLLNEQHEPVMVWKLRNAWPVSLRGPSLNASRSEIAIETLELAHEGLIVQAT